MNILVLIGVFAAFTVVQAGGLWLASKLTRVDGAFLPFLLTCFLCNLIRFIPGLGGILSLIAYFALLKVSTGADSWIDIALLVVVAWGLQFFAVISLIPMLGKMGG